MSLVGSKSGCKFRLADPSVSAVHCSLLRTPEGLWVVDLLGRGGITVNDVLVRFALLADNDVLRVGRYQIRIKSRFDEGNSASTTPKAAPRSSALVSRPSRPATLEPIIPLEGSIGPETTQLETTSEALTPVSVSAQSSAIEWVSPPRSPIQLEKGEISESLLVPLVNQFGLMQQNMLDQFQQTISMLVSMFGNLQREQLDTIREELDQIHSLTKEFHALKSKLEKRSGDEASPTPERPAPLPPQGALLGFASAAGESDKRGLGTQTALRRETAQSQPAPTFTSPALSGVESRGAHLTPDSPGTLPPVHASSDASAPEASGTSSASPGAPTGEATREADRDTVIWLHERMMLLQQERETRWQKILKLLPGLS
jgi:hypothetical protein